MNRSRILPSLRGVFVAALAAFCASSPALRSLARDFTEAERQHWAFQSVRDVPPPLAPLRLPSFHPVDAFLQPRLESAGIDPAPAADRATLIRRATFDLTGLPPTPDEVASFVADSDPDAYLKVINRLLASPHYGERWARHWLDLARYAESEGFKADETRPNAWRYRDYVIRAFNDDKPYDRFVQEQIAGDEFWPEDSDAKVATAFNRHYPDESNARNLRQRRQEILNDITDTVGSVFTGLTYGCARCHDHKFDPILQTDYYQLQAFFANTAAEDRIPLVPSTSLQEYQTKLRAWEEQTKALREEMHALEEPHRRAILKDYIDKYPAEIQAALAKPEAERSAFECQMVAKAKLYLSPDSHQYIASTETVAGRLKGQDKERWLELKAQLKEFDPLHPGELPIATGMQDLGAMPPETFLLSRGIYDAPRESVSPGFLAILRLPVPVVAALPKSNSTGRRAALASLLTHPAANPLTARVMVNRIWQYHFGRGLVPTPSDFGMKGEPPTHPDLLDWLAREFMARSWSIKQMHRLIMTSQAYQRSSQGTASAALDPENKLLGRFPRHRLEGEVIRDAALAVAGLLNPKMGGPSIFPELPPGMQVRGGWKVTASPFERNRRSIYVFVRRNTRYPLFESFDMPDTHESCSRRNVTTSPLQALMLLNSPPALDWAQHFAAKVIQYAGSERHLQVAHAWQMAYSRPPSTAELELIRNFFDRQQEILAERAAAGEPLALPPQLPAALNPVEASALVDFCHMLLNSNEFVYLN